MALTFVNVSELFPGLDKRTKNYEYCIEIDAVWSKHLEGYLSHTRGNYRIAGVYITNAQMKNAYLAYERYNSTKAGSNKMTESVAAPKCQKFPFIIYTTDVDSKSKNGGFDACYYPAGSTVTTALEEDFDWEGKESADQVFILILDGVMTKPRVVSARQTVVRTFDPHGKAAEESHWEFFW